MYTLEIIAINFLVELNPWLLLIASRFFHTLLSNTYESIPVSYWALARDFNYLMLVNDLYILLFTPALFYIPVVIILSLCKNYLQSCIYDILCQFSIDWKIFLLFNLALTARK